MSDEAPLVAGPLDMVDTLELLTEVKRRFPICVFGGVPYEQYKSGEMRWTNVLRGTVCQVSAMIGELNLVLSAAQAQCGCVDCKRARAGG